MSSIHSVGKNFDIEKFLLARSKTIAALEEGLAYLKNGMGEEQGTEAINKLLKKMGSDKLWHPTKFRIGKNTVKSFREMSEVGVNLMSDDIFFIDIGPVWDGYEGDYGRTFSRGKNAIHEKLIQACEHVFFQTSQYWRDHKKTGKELYDFATSCAEGLGYQLNHQMKGHRLGDFPHHLFYRKGLIDTDEVPVNHLWVLEIHLIDRRNQIGAFYEDILSD